MFVLLLHVIACKAVLDSWGRKETLQTTGTKLHSYYEKFHETVLNTVEAFWMDALISRQLYLHNSRLYKTLFFQSPIHTVLLLSHKRLSYRYGHLFHVLKVSAHKSFRCNIIIPGVKWCNDPWKLRKGVEDVTYSFAYFDSWLFTCMHKFQCKLTKTKLHVHCMSFFHFPKNLIQQSPWNYKNFMPPSCWYMYGCHEEVNVHFAWVQTTDLPQETRSFSCKTVKNKY